MKTLVILVFFGIVIFKVSNCQEHDIEKVDNGFSKNELDVNIDEVADANAKKRDVRKKKKGKKWQVSKRRKKQLKKKRRQAKKLNRKQEKAHKKQNNRNKTQKKKTSKRPNNRNKAQKKNGSKKRKKRKRTQKKKGGKKRKNLKKKKALKKKRRQRKFAGRQVPCEKGCTDIFVQMMKESRRITTFLKQYNRIINGQKRADSKFSKKGNFDKDKDDSPLKLMLEAGGGNKSDMECAGSKQNPAAVLMKNITEKLDICAQKIAENCNKSMWSKIKPEWVECNASMISLTNLTNECMRKPGKSACDCFNKTAVKDGLKKIKSCNSTDMLKAANNDKKSKKICIDTYANCRHVGEETRKVISVCAPGGPALEDITKHMGIAKKHFDTTMAIQEKVKTLMASRRYRIRKDRSVEISGITYTLEACQDWVTACHKYFDELKNPANDEVVDAGETISSTTVTCSATDKQKLKALLIRTEHVLRRLAHFIKHTGQKLEKISGSTVSVEHAVSIFVAGKPTRPANSKYTTKTPYKPSVKPPDNFYCPQYKKDVAWMKGEKGMLGTDAIKSPRDCQRYCHQYNAKLNPHQSTYDPKASTPYSKDSTPHSKDSTPYSKDSSTPKKEVSVKASVSEECHGFTYWNEAGPYSSTTWCFIYAKPKDGVVIEKTAVASKGAISGLVLDCQPGNHDGTVYPTFAQTGATPAYDDGKTKPGYTEYTKPGGAAESKPSQPTKDAATKPSEASKDPVTKPSSVSS